MSDSKNSDSRIPWLAWILISIAVSTLGACAIVRQEEQSPPDAIQSPSPDTTPTPEELEELIKDPPQLTPEEREQLIKEATPQMRDDFILTPEQILDGPVPPPEAPQIIIPPPSESSEN